MRRCCRKRNGASRPSARRRASEAEKKAAWMVFEQTPPKQAMALSNIVTVLAKRGGYGNRRDGGPSEEMIWRGLRRILNIAMSWQAFGPER